MSENAYCKNASYQGINTALANKDDGYTYKCKLAVFPQLHCDLHNTQTTIAAIDMYNTTLHMMQVLAI